MEGLSWGRAASVEVFPHTEYEDIYQNNISIVPPHSPWRFPFQEIFWKNPYNKFGRGSIYSWNISLYW